MGQARHEKAVILLESDDGSVGRLRQVRILTSPENDVLLVCRTPLTASRVWLKRVGHRFDRKFTECRLTHVDTVDPQARVYYYGLKIVGFADWWLLTEHLHRTLFRGVAPKPSTLQPEPAAVPRRRPEQSLVPLLSAIGLVVVYATNFTW